MCLDSSRLPLLNVLSGFLFSSQGSYQLFSKHLKSRYFPFFFNKIGGSV